MTPEEIFEDVNAKNREALSKMSGKLTGEEMVVLMNAAAMYGFKLGSDMAMSMVKGALLTKLVQLDK